MIVQAEAEILCKKLMEDYVNTCQCDSDIDVANVLMKLISICGIGICAVTGREDAVLRLNGTAEFINKSFPNKWKKEIVQ